MATSKFMPAKGHRAKLTRQHVLGDADDNATAVVTIPAGDAYQGHVIIDEIVAGYNGTAASKNVTIAQGSLSVALAITSGAVTVENPVVLIPESASYLAAGTAVTITLDASGTGGTDGFVVVKYRLENER